MSTLTLLNVAVQSFLLAGAGWLWLRLCVRDARARAWAALWVLLLSGLAPWVLVSTTSTLPGTTGTPSVAPVLWEWQPDWKVRVEADAAPSAPLPVVSAPAGQGQGAPQPWHWREAVLRLPYGWIWGLGTALLLLRLGVATWRQHRWLRQCVGVPAIPLSGEAAAVPWRLLPGSGSPCVGGWLRPVILVPQQAVNQYSPAQWRWVWQHEAEHLRGRDPLIHWLLQVGRAVWWWNPCVHALADMWALAREQVCDAAAVQPGREQPGAYASFLLQIAAQGRGPLAMAASRPARWLRVRLRTLLAGQPVQPRVRPGFAAGLCLVSLLAVWMVGWTGFAEEPAHTPVGKPAGQGSQSKGIVKRTYVVPPDLIKAPDGTRQTPLAWLAAGDIPFPEGAGAEFVASSSTLVVHQTEENQLRVQQYLDRMTAQLQQSKVQVYLTTKLMALPKETAVETQALSLDFSKVTTFTDPQFQLILRALSQQRGIDLISAPSVTTRSTLTAMIQHIKEVKDAAAKDDFIGYRMELTPTVVGEQITLGIKADYATQGDGPSIVTRDDTGQVILSETPYSAEVTHLRREESLQLSNGHTLLLPMGTLRSGERVLLFITALLFDPAGKALPKSEKGTAVSTKPDVVIPDALKLPLRMQVQSCTVPALTDDDLLKMGMEPKGGKKTHLWWEESTVWVLFGVFTPEQRDTVMQTLSAKPGYTAADAQETLVAKDQVVPYHLAAGQPELCRITPSLGQDQRTIDLSLQFLPDAQTQTTTTSVTIWNQQTIGLAKREKGTDGKDQLRLLLVTVAGY